MSNRRGRFLAKIHYVIFGLKIIRHKIREILLIKELLGFTLMLRLERLESSLTEMILFLKTLKWIRLFPL